MLTVELDGTLGVVGMKLEALFCFVCKAKTCKHVNEVEKRENSSMTAVMEFFALTSIVQPRYERKCFSTKKIPFEPIDTQVHKIQAPPWHYLPHDDDDGLCEVGKTWVCSCGAQEERVKSHEILPLFSTSYLMQVHGE